MITVGSIVIRVDDLERQKAFWTAALDYVPREGDDDTFALLRPRNGEGPNISLDRVRSTLQIPPSYPPRPVCGGSGVRGEAFDRILARPRSTGTNDRRTRTTSS
jgi:hypothetical protein